MADLGNLQFSVSLKDMTDADIQKIKNKLEKAGFKIDAKADRRALEKSISDILKNRTFKIDVEPNKKIKKASIEVNKSILSNSVTNALKGKTFKANVDVVVKSASVQDAIKQAFAKAGMNYNTTASNLRAQRVLEIQQRMALRAAKANKELSKSYRQASSGADQFARASLTLNNGLHANIRLGGQLGSILGNFASIFGIKDLLRDMVLIGGELENQKIALGAILQDGGKATDMFSKIQTLAVESPFGVMDLNQYVKQLAAYSVPYNELYETMKRLADISAGVGVDMGRIILAFGQVKAAGFLKGTELRQFTEANIPMVDKLAERFTNLTGKIVGAAEVYDMISKKKVTFEDVKSVLWDLTDEGGMFNNMQQVLSESLASKWKNLADAIDVMYGKIADGWIGDALKGFAVMLTEITKGWQYVSTAITSATVAFLAHKTAVLLGTKQMSNARSVYASIMSGKQQEAAMLRQEQYYRKLTKAEQTKIDTSGKLTKADVKKAVATGQLGKAEALRLITLKKLNPELLKGSQRMLGISAAEIRAAQGASRLKIAWTSLTNGARALGVALKGLLFSPWTIALGVITAIGELFTYWKNESDKLKEITNGIKESALGSVATIQKELDRLKGIKIGELDDTAVKIQIEQLAELIKNEAPYWQGILSEVFAQDASGNFVNTAKEQLELLINKIKDVQKAKQTLLDNPEAFANALKGTDGWYDEPLTDNLVDYEKAIKKNEKNLERLRNHYRHVQEAIDIATKSNNKFLEESEGKSIQQKVILLRKYKDEFASFINILKKNSDKANSIVKKYTDGLSDIWNGDVWGNVSGDINYFQQDVWKELLSMGYTRSSFLDESARQVVMYFGQKLIQEAKVQDPKVIEHFWREYLKYFNNLKNTDFSVVPEGSYKTTPETEYDPSKDKVAELWKNRAEEIDKAIKAYDKWKEVEGKDKASQRIKGMSEFADLFNGKYGFNLDLENPTASYEYIQSKLNKSLEKQRELYISLGVKVNEAELDDAKDALKIFLDESKKYIDETTSKWNLYKKIFEATGNKTTAMNIAFGKDVGFTNLLEQLRSQIEQGLKGTKFNFSDVIGLTDKELEENGLSPLKHFIEAYNKESQKISEETIENFLDIIKASKDFAQQISDIETKLVRDLNTIYGSLLPSEEKSRLEKQLYENYEENIAKINFEKFKKTSGWVSIFDDLSKVSTGTLDGLLEDIEKFIPGGVKSEKVFKELIKSVRKIKDELLNRNPFRAFSSESVTNLGEINKAIADYNEQIRKAKENGDLDRVKNLESKKYEEQSKRREIYDDYATAFKAGMSKITDFANSVGEVSSLLERFGNDSLKNFASFLDSISKGMQSGYNVGGIFGGAGGVIGGFVGTVTGAMAGIVEAGQNAVKAEQERSQVVIDRLEKVASILKDKIADSLTGLYNSSLSYTAKVEMELQKQRYDAAEKYYKDKGETVKENEIKATTFDNTSFSWDLDNYIIYSKKTHDAINKAIESDNEYMAAYASMLAQRDELIYQQATYSDKDSDDVEAFKRDKALEIEKLTIEIEQLSKDMLSSLYSIDFKDWAGQFADAIVGAWSKGEDAAKAYQDVVSDVMKNVATSMIQQLVIGRYLEEQLPNFVDKFIANNGLFDDELLAELGGVIDGLTGRIEIAENLLDGWEDKLNEKGISLKETEGKENSLSKGIQSVTEDTANLLASYLNSIRQNVSVKRSLIEKLIGEDMPKMSVIAQAQLTQLNIIASNTLRNADTADRIYELVNRVVDRGSNKLKI